MEETKTKLGPDTEKQEIVEKLFDIVEWCMANGYPKGMAINAGGLKFGIVIDTSGMEAAKQALQDAMEKSKEAK